MDVLGIAHDAEDARSIIFAEEPDYVLMDLRLGEADDGVDIAKQVHDRLPDIKAIFITGSNEPSSFDRIDTDYPYRILIKPISPPDLAEAFAYWDWLKTENGPPDFG